MIDGKFRTPSQITRTECLKCAIETAKNFEEFVPNVNKLIDIAKELEMYVNTGD